MHQILCVEDTEETMLILESALDGYQLAWARTVSDAKELFGDPSRGSKRFSLILLDLGLPDGTGFDLLAHFYGQPNPLPLIVLTGRNDITSKVSAFSLGADDYVQKPFDPRELRLRVDSKIKKNSEKKERDTFLQIGDVCCSVEEQKVRRLSDQKLIDLTSLEFRIFYLLGKAPNKIFTRDEILDKIWGRAIAVTDRTVDVHISNLRRKFSGLKVSIETVVGTGYRISTEGN